MSDKRFVAALIGLAAAQVMISATYIALKGKTARIDLPKIEKMQHENNEKQRTYLLKAMQNDQDQSY